MQGTGEYNLSGDIIDVLSVIIRRDGTDYALERLSRDEYLTIPTKTTQSRPNQFFLDRQITPNLKIWPVPQNSTDVIYYDALTRMDDADVYTNTMDLPFRFYPCLAAGLAYYIALKRAPNSVQMLKACTKKSLIGRQLKIVTGLRLTLYLDTNIIGQADG